MTSTLHTEGIKPLTVLQVSKHSTNPQPLGVLINFGNTPHFIPFLAFTKLDPRLLERYPTYFIDLPQEQQVLPSRQHYVADHSTHITTLPKNHVLVLLTHLLITEGETVLDISMEVISNKLKL